MGQGSRSKRSSEKRSSRLLAHDRNGSKYERLSEVSPTRQTDTISHITSQYDPPSPIDDLSTFAAATGGLGLSFDNGRLAKGPSTPLQTRRRGPTITTTDADDGGDGDDGIVFSPDEREGDTTPLTDNKYLQPALKRGNSSAHGQRHDRGNRTSASLAEGSSPGRSRTTSRLGDDLPGLNTTLGVHRQPSSTSGISRLSPASANANSTNIGEHSRERSLSPSPLARANSMLRMMSQRVVNLGNDTDMVAEQQEKLRRKSSVRMPRPSFDYGRSDSTGGPLEIDVENLSIPSPAEEKRPSFTQIRAASPVTPLYPRFQPNPLRGKSLGIFGPDNKLRKWLMEILVHPAIEPVILLLIVLQTVLLAVNAAPSVYNDPRSRNWGSNRIDYALLGLFIIYTLEVVAKIIVSGLISNPVEYSTIDRSKGLKKAILTQASNLFSVHHNEAPKRKGSAEPPINPSIVRAFTGSFPDPDAPISGRQLQRMRLARRAFLRHSFNRLDFIAVLSYWISFVMMIFKFESGRHVYIFEMLSCLRMLRLLNLTSGTSIILRSLKRAAPLLVNVAFLISFFWLLFGIVGVQSFKSSLRRTCVWVGPESAGGNYTQNIAPENIQFCGGHLDATTGSPMPWITELGQNGTNTHKGFLCPQGSFCVQGGNPYNNTVSFDNIAQSMMLVFVGISSNTFSDLLYYLTNSDYLAAALFFAAIIVVMTFWLVNLLIAVITSSFQIIREESKQSAFTAEVIEPPVLHDEKQKRSNLKKLYDRTYWFWNSNIAAGLVIMCFRTSHMTHQQQQFVLNGETILTGVLALEIVLRFACDWRHFFHSKRNCVDFALAVITCVTQIPQIRNSGQPYAWLTFFQIVRIYRLVLAIPMTRNLIMLVFTNVVGLLNLIVFAFLMTFLVAILASQMFRGDFPQTDNAGNVIRVTFFNIYNSFLGMYQILSSENWTAIMYNITQFDDRWDTAWLGAMFCIMWFILANLIILNMFIAVIQESFDVSEDEKRVQQIQQFLKQKEATAATGNNLSLASMLRLGRESARQKEHLEYSHAALEQLLKDEVVNEFLDDSNQQPKPIQRAASSHIDGLPAPDVQPGMLSKWWGKISGLHGHREPNPFFSQDDFSRADVAMDPRTRAKKIAAAADNRRRAQRQYLLQHPKYNVSLFIFGPKNLVRTLCQKIVPAGRGERIEGSSPYKPVWWSFSAFIYAAIVAMVLLACVTTPLYQREYYTTHEIDIRNWFVWTDMAFAILFTVEALIKIIADGFFFTPNAYFRSVWGFIDGIVLITLWVNVITSLYQETSIARAVGAFKALRALRLLNISDNARDTFYAVIILGGWKVLSTALVSLSLLVPFAILGLNIFNGQMESCNDQFFGNSYTNLTNCVGEWNSTPFNWEVLAPRSVSNPYYSFDNFGSSLFILFQIVSQEGWTDVMWTAMSMTGVGIQPRAFTSQGNAVFFIIFNLLGSIFILTLFVSVFMRNYTEQTGVAFLTADQRSWLELRKLMERTTPYKKSIGDRTGKFRKWCYQVSYQKRSKWQRFLTGLLVFHLILLMIEFYPSVGWWDLLREYIFLALTCVYAINILIRIFGLSWTRFSRSSWDLFSIPAVGGTFVTTLMSLSDNSDPTFDQLHKLFLVSVAFLLIPRNNSLDQLFKTAAASIRSIGNLLATWLVLFLTYAIAFTQTFGLTRFGANENGNLNFRDVPKALILLFRMSCGEGWNAIMEDFATIRPPYCVVSDDFFQSDCGSANWARALFISWNIISMYIFVSLFVSLIFESFSYVYQRSSGLSIISRDEVRRFKQAWCDFDPRGTGFISKEDFPRLLGELSGVFQMRIYDGDFTVRNLIEDCQVQPGDPLSKSRRVVEGIDLDKLNERLSLINVAEIRARRVRVNLFYNEVLNKATDRGIPFTLCLLTLLVYNVINDSKSYQLEEYLNRRARLQRVHETIRRNVVVGFFDTMFWSRWLRRQQNARRASRMEGVPQISVPEIFVDNPDDSLEDLSSPTPHDFMEAAPLHPSPSFAGASKAGSKSLRNLPQLNTSAMSNPLFGPPSPTTRSPVHSPTNRSPSHSPTLGRHSRNNSNVSPTLSPHRLTATDASYPGATPMHSRQTSAISNGSAGVMETFEDSAWGQSMRRSFSLARPSVADGVGTTNGRRSSRSGTGNGFEVLGGRRG
jgi:hypothetical protein